MRRMIKRGEEGGKKSRDTVPRSINQCFTSLCNTKYVYQTENHTFAQFNSVKYFVLAVSHYLSAIFRWRDNGLWQNMTIRIFTK